MIYRYIAYGLLVVLIFGAGYHQGKKAFYELEAHVAVLGNLARKQAEELAAKNLKEKEKADAQAKVDRARIAALSRSLREHRSSRGFLPPSAPGAPSPERVTLDRAELERALQRLDERVSGLIAEGDQAIVGLDSAKAWAKDIAPRE